MKRQRYLNEEKLTIDLIYLKEINSFYRKFTNYGAFQRCLRPKVPYKRVCSSVTHSQIHKLKTYFCFPSIIKNKGYRIYFV